jgi:hypothetical protein
MGKITQKIFPLKYSFGIGYSIGRKYQPMWVSVSDLHQNSGFGRTLPYSKSSQWIEIKFVSRFFFLPSTKMFSQILNYQYLTHWIQEPIPKLRIWNFHDFF